MSPSLRMLRFPALAFAGFWIADSLLGLFFFSDASLTTLLFHPSPYNLGLRTIFGGVLAGVILYFQIIKGRHLRTRDRLIQQKELYQSLVESSPQCFIVHRDFNILFVNQYSLDFFALPELGDYAGTPIFTFIPAEHHDRVRLIVDLVLAGEDAPSSELQVQRLDGTAINIRSTSAQVNWDGQPAVLTVFRDITEELEQRREMAITGERLRLALDAAQDGVWDWDVTKGKMVYNEAWASMLGLSLAEIDGSLDTWRSLIHPDDIPRAEDHLESHLKGSVSSYEIEVRLLHKEGHYIWVLDRGKVVERDGQGQPLRMTGTHRNITARKEAELALEIRNRVAETFLTRETETLYLQILRVISEALEAPIGLFASLNSQGELMVRATSGQFHPDQPAMEPDLRFDPQLLPPIFQSVLKDRQVHFSNDPTNIPGHLIPLKSVLGVPISSREKVLGAIFLGNKEGGFQKADQVFLESLAGYIAPLLHAHLNSETKEDQLRQAQKMEALGALAGGIAHDFNNILQAIMGFTSLALDDVSPEGNVPDDLQRVLKAARRGQELVQRIQLFSRRDEQKYVSLDIQSVVQETINLLQPTIPATIEIKSHLNSMNARIFGDPGQISQVILNLATNAYHAMEADGGQLSFDLRTCSGNRSSYNCPENPTGKDLVSLTVSDTGAGMSEQVKTRLYDPFFTTKEVGQGTGLGMSVVHGIVKAHKGEIHIESELGKGTTVRICLPQHSQRNLYQPPRNKTQTPPLIAGVRKIAILDDEKDISDLGKVLLEKMGHQVITENHAPTLLASLERDPQLCDLIITDLTMPRITGLQLAERLEIIRADLPIILITGMSEQKDVSLENHPNIKGLIRKPFTGDSLRQCVNRILAEGGDAPCPES